MAHFLLIVSKIRTSFFRPVDLRTPLPARSINAQEIARLDLRVYCFVAAASSSEKQWLSQRAFEEASEGDNVICLPRGRELNQDKIICKTYECGALYCGIEEPELVHLNGPTVLQHKLGQRLAGLVTRTTNVRDSMGKSLCTSGLDSVA